MDAIIEPEDESSLPNNTIHCPCCETEVPSEDFLHHCLFQHPQFFAVWATYNMPTILQPNPFQYVPSWMNTGLDDIDGEEEDLSYEYLSALCDQIGYHKVGCSNVDDVAPIVQAETESTRCAICLEDLDGTVPVRQIHVCQHLFCKDCLESWLKENKTCPICVRRVDEPETQIASMSKSDPSSSSSSILPVSSDAPG